MSDDVIHVACASDQRYFEGLLGTLMSILVSSKSCESFQFHILDGGISTKSWSILDAKVTQTGALSPKRYNIDQAQFGDMPDFQFDSKMAYARLLLPDILPDLEKVIYIDSDILVLKDLGELWEMDLGNYISLVALEEITGVIENDATRDVLDIYKINPRAPYFNSGLMYIHLKRFSECSIGLKTISHLQKHPESCRFWDQSALNITLYDGVQFIDQSWNTQSHREVFRLEDRIGDFENRSINFHFVTRNKPWMAYHEALPFRMFKILLNELGLEDDEKFLKSKNEFYTKRKLVLLIKLKNSIMAYLRPGQRKSLRRINHFWNEEMIQYHFNQKHSTIIYSILDDWKIQIRQCLKKSSHE